jgi:hypothetical protein
MLVQDQIEVIRTQDLPVQEIEIDEEKVRRAIQLEVPLIMTTFTLPREIERYIEKVVTMFLEQIKLEELKDSLAYCVQELVVNAKKANTKRVYFMERGLNLYDPGDYQTGMADFKEDTLKNIAYYLQLQKKWGLYIKVILQIKKDVISIEVRNNVKITNAELNRIYDKLVRARQFDTLDDAIAQLVDNSEGAGLGLVILALLMKKAGLEESCFNILRTNRETIARIIIPPTTGWRVLDGGGI